MKNFKLFDLDNGQQILATRDTNDDDQPCITFSFFTDICKVDIGIGYSKEDSRDKMFESLTKENADGIYNKMINDMFI